MNATEPFPVPLDPEVTTTHVAPLVAVQAQPDCVETATDAARLSGPTLRLVDEMANVQGVVFGGCGAGEGEGDGEGEGGRTTASCVTVDR
jgi:hypothetical protein